MAFVCDGQLHEVQWVLCTAFWSMDMAGVHACLFEAVCDVTTVPSHLKQIQSPRFQSKYNRRCFSFHDSVILFCRRKIPACISHWVSVVVILLQENRSKRHVTCVSVNPERLRYISKMQNRSGYQHRLDIFKGLLPLVIPREYAMSSSYLIQRFCQFSIVTNKFWKVIGKSKETPLLAYIPRYGPIFNSLKFDSLGSCWAMLIF